MAVSESGAIDWRPFLLDRLMWKPIRISPPMELMSVWQKAKHLFFTTRGSRRMTQPCLDRTVWTADPLIFWPDKLWAINHNNKDFDGAALPRGLPSSGREVLVDWQGIAPGAKAPPTFWEHWGTRPRQQRLAQLRLCLVIRFHDMCFPSRAD